MNKKKILIFTIFVILFIICILIYNNKKILNYNVKKNKEYSLFSDEVGRVENEIKNAFGKSYSIYKKNNYYGFDILNQFLNDFDVMYIDNIDIIDFNFIKIYDKNGNELLEFPVNKLPEYSNEIYNIKNGNNYLARIWSNDTKLTYYYIFSINDEVSSTPLIEFICYTEGENDRSGRFMFSNELKENF